MKDPAKEITLLSDTEDAPATEALLKAIVDSSDDAIISKDLNSTVTSWNRSAERLFGYSALEMLGRSIKILIPTELLAEEDVILAKIRTGERIEHFETLRKRKDGRLVEVSVSISPVHSIGGKIVGASKVARDISETKRAARANLLLAAIVNSSDDAIISKNLDGTITSWNAGAERIFGYTAQEIIGQSVMMLIPEERKDEEPKILSRLRNGERVDHFETVRLRKNGEKIDVSLTISPVKDTDGKVIGASKIARDIAIIKKTMAEREVLLESERVARTLAEQANRLKDDFIATVSHELRTPLNAIVGWTDVLAECSDSPKDVLHGVKIIKNNALMQAQLIEDLLDLGRISAGKMVLQTETLDLFAIMRDAIASVQHAADSKRISLRILPSDFSLKMEGDARRLQQVIWNLVSNAIKFTPNGGHVTIFASQIGSALEITVTDDGIGISPEFLPHLFARFRQADSSTTRRTGGLGIGLALVKQLIELHGGSVIAESRGLGAGSTFKVTLPIPSVPENRHSDTDFEKKPKDELEGLKVLTVDDDANALEVLKRILTNRKAEVRTAHSVAEAFSILSTFKPDVILSDIGMPGQDGYDFIRKLRTDPRLGAIPAVALTALARIEDRTAALTAGFQTHIMKPVAGAELVAVVRSFGNLHTMQRRMDTKPIDSDSKG